MIIWKKDSKSEIAKPNIYLMPSLTRSVGKVKIIKIVKNSLNHVIVN